MRRAAEFPISRFGWMEPRRCTSVRLGVCLLPLVAAACLLSGCNSRKVHEKEVVADVVQPAQVEDLKPVPFSEKDAKVSYESEDHGLEVVYMDFGDQAGF